MCACVTFVCGMILGNYIIFLKKEKKKEFRITFLCDNQKEKSVTWKCFMFSAVKLLKQEVYFRDKGERKKNTSAIQRF